MKRLSEQEEEAMQAVWKTKGGFIRDFLELMPEPKPPYTTLASTIRSLAKKKILKGKKMANSIFYSPLIRQEDYKKQFMSGIVTDYFENSYKGLVSFFAKQKKISTEDLKEIIRLIESEEKK